MMTKKTEEGKKYFVTTSSDVTVGKTASKWRWLWALLVVLAAGIFIYIMWAWLQPGRVGATDTCPSGEGWVKVEGLSGTTYEYEPPNSCEVTDNCYKHATYVHYGTGATVTADWHWVYVGRHWQWKQYDLSHASFKLACEPTVTPTPPVCDEQQYTCGECSEKPNDDWCGEYKYDYCKDNYSCGYIDDEWVCACPTEPPTTPTPTPETRITTTSTPSGCTENCGTPACTDSTPKEPANPHIYRNGDCAIVKWYPTEGDKANIYYKQVTSDGWQYSVVGIPNTGNYQVCGLDSMDITFAVQQVNGCAAGASVLSSEIVDGDTPTWVLFR